MNNNKYKVMTTFDSSYLKNMYVIGPNLVTQKFHVKGSYEHEFYSTKTEAEAIKLAEFLNAGNEIGVPIEIEVPDLSGLYIYQIEVSKNTHNGNEQYYHAKVSGYYFFANGKNEAAAVIKVITKINDNHYINKMPLIDINDVKIIRNY